ncbi:radical SAM protein [Eubacterium sp. 1001713B170207_170306_E7]|uniref:radical SAM protein n=1 Tax=Eubacterium sp. 1001713B170207_170306_E7 TaxID=2787097 RepID=UPI00189A8F42|nr:radical SAM protein [Eubacterium sp. 1001713B170207_170306_E7]
MSIYKKFIQYLAKESVSKGKAFSATLEITKRCNLLCEFCYLNGERNKLDLLDEKSTDEWIEFITKCIKNNVFYINFTGGEVLTRPDFEEIYTKTYDMGTKICVFTNGTLLNDSYLQLFKKRPPDSIDITLYGMSAERYEQICGNGDAYYRVMEAIDNLQKAGLPVQTKTNALPALAGDYEQIAEYVKDHRLSFRFSGYMGPERDCPGQMDSFKRIPPEKVLKFQKLFCEQGLIGIQEQDTRECHEQCFRCMAGKSSFFVSSEGKMTTCPMFTGFYTEPFKDGFEVAWEQLKQKVKNAEACEDCLSCEEYAYCTKCPANLYSETGSTAKCSAYLKALAHNNRVLNEIKKN